MVHAFRIWFNTFQFEEKYAPLEHNDLSIVSLKYAVLKDS